MGDLPNPVQRKSQHTMTEPLRVFSTSPAAHFEAVFRQIAQERMAGLPVLNPRVEVRAHAFRRWQNDWIGAMVTPWSIFALYACGCRAAWEAPPPGKCRLIELPGGDFPFEATGDALLAGALTLPLKSPILDVADQETADLIAAIALETMLKADRIPEDDEDARVSIPEQKPGTLRRVIPIEVAPPKDYESAPPLTPRPPEEEAPEPEEPFFERPLSRREIFFGRGKKTDSDASGEGGAP